jgi:excinuclease ABC subunit B
MANVIEQTQKPALIIAHNKTLAAQLYSEFREFFPKNAVELLRQLLRLLPARSLHPAHRHLHREGLRRSTKRSTGCAWQRPAAGFSRRDVVIVASVSCIYGLGSPQDYGPGVTAHRRGEMCGATNCCAIWWTSTTTATIWNCSAALSACAATCWKCSRLPRDRLPHQFWGDEVERISEI